MELVSVDNLCSGMVVAQDIDLGTGFLSLITKDTILTDIMIQSLKERGSRFIYIKEQVSKGRKNRRPAVGKASELPVIPKRDPVISPRLREESISSLQEIFQTVTLAKGDIHASSVRLIKHLDTVVEQLVDSILEEKGAMVNINDLKSYDEYTFHHSLSVAVLSIAIAQRMGLSRMQLNNLGMCAIMHDIGKISVPVEVINKPSRLDEREFSIVKTHSPAGYEYLTQSAIEDEEIWRGVLCHHEKFDGSGYPYGIKGNDIPLWSRIISVADVYDALTSNRPYRTPMHPAEAVEYIMGGTGKAFDYDIVQAFIRKLDIYPVGTYVGLSNGWIGVVVNAENSMRPVVRLEPKGEYVDLYHDRSLYSVVIDRVFGDGFKPGHE